MVRAYYIAICDDDAYYRDQIHHLLEQYQKEREVIFQIDEYTSGKKLLEATTKLEDYYHIIFMDVDMPDIKGIDTVKKLREGKNTASICFVTAYQEYAYSAFQVEALDYVQKPISYEKLAMFMDKAIEWKAMQWEKQEAGKKYLEIVQKKDIRVIEQDEIWYIEKRRNQCVVITETEEIVCYDTLQNIYQNLNEAVFEFAHQGYIVNFYRIKEIRNNVAFLGNGIEIPISRKYLEPLKKRFNNKLERLRQERIK